MIPRPFLPELRAILGDGRSAGHEVSGDLCEAILVLIIGMILDSSGPKTWSNLLQDPRTSDISLFSLTLRRGGNLCPARRP